MFEEISFAEVPEAKREPETIAVYRKGNQLVLRQRHSMTDEEPYIVVPIDGAEGLIQAIQRELKTE
jgi:hypothetical protein